ncbi:PLP-dependent aminotransferase family protein [Streptomyces orinoci]|uniref:PLP-dependent aminotransferase family protein n=1 Tax=Streptomyces orinoci TaxID=67339 RepID=A0ABV3JQP7_STRON|nr:PLP-dependent aminotransferase family protein [Streptomyces orinoci]
MGTSEPLITLDRESAVPLQRQVCEQFTALIRAGRLRPGETVPASRELAGQLGVSRTVVLRAYELLRAHGVLTAKRGSGTRIALSVEGVGATEPACRTPLAPQPPRPTDAGHALWQPWEPPPVYEQGDLLDFRHGTPALNEFPVARWRQSLTEAYAKAGATALGYGPAEGAAALRTEIAALVRRSRALAVPPDQVLVTAGATQAIDILVRLLVRPGDVVVIEDPSHTVLRQIFGFSEAAVVPVPVDEEGLRVAEIDERVRAQGLQPERVRLVFVTPSHQFPTGVVMSQNRRRALVAWAQRRGVTVLEDDYHNEFAFSGERLPALAADPHGGTVVYVGTFSKTLFPALRIGYAVLPRQLVRPFLGLKWITDRLSPTVEQEALAEFIASGAYARHIARTTRLYRQRRRRLLEELYGRFGAGVRISGAAAGLHVLVTLSAAAGADETEIARRATARGVRVYPASGYYVLRPPEEPSFLMGYAALPAARITAGVELLAEAVQEVKRASRR